MIEIGTLLQDRYLIEKQIGAGGMGAVYLAIDQRFGSPVAIKETFYKDEELGDAFEREAHLLNSLLHPVLPHVSDYFTENNGHFLVMQFIEGEDLSGTLKREGAFPVQDVVRWADNLLDALDYLHSQEPPVIHRDIKPQNLKITPRGDVILLDFGLAKLNSNEALGAVSVFGYSRTYSPLEQIQGTGTDARSDIFALGATVYHLLTGKPPIDVLSRAAAIVAGNPDPLPLASDINNNVPVALAVALKSALALNPDQRFTSAKAMRLALQFAVNSENSETNKEVITPVQAAASAVIGSHAIHTVETDHFPALESFVDDVKNTPQIETENNLNGAEVLPSVKTAVPPVQPDVQPIYINDAATVVTTGNKNFRYPLAAAAAILIFAVLAAGYFLISTSSANETDQSPVASSISAETDESPENASEALSYKPQTTAATSAEIPNKNKDTSTSKKSPVEKNEAPEPETEETKLIESPNVEPATEIIRSNPVPSQRRKAPQPTRNSNPRQEETGEVPDIEAIFTGRPNEERADRQRGNGEIEGDVISEEEWKQMQRERREERRKRRNNKPLPF
ncbi:MAG: protein kinase [Acidobacteria bacterium]|nr:protein kinase [Acidobacteriota bacterium]